MAKVGKDCTDGIFFLHVVEEESELCFCGKGEYVAHNRREYNVGAVDRGIWFV